MIAAEPGFRIQFRRDGVEYSGYIRKIQRGPMFEASAYYINGVAQGRYTVHTGILAGEIISVEPDSRKYKSGDNE